MEVDFHGQIRYHLWVWIGAHASRADRARAERVHRVDRAFSATLAGPGTGQAS